MNIYEVLNGRMSQADIRAVCAYTSGTANDVLKSELYSFIDDSDDRVGYNALWVFTHFAVADSLWLLTKRDDIINRILIESHTGKRRLLLVLLERMPPVGVDSVRTDYLDFCLSRIISTEPYGIRALCMKQAYAQCRLFPELLDEFLAILNMLDAGDLSLGLKTARRNILKSIAKEQKKSHN